MTDNINIDYKYIEYRIATYLNEYEIGNGIHILDMKRNQFNYILIQIYENVIKSIYNQSMEVINQNIIVIPDDIIEYICKLYIQICYKYNKSITIMGYSYIIGINYHTIINNITNSNKEYIYTDTITNNAINYREIKKYTEKYRDRSIIRISNNIISKTYKTIVSTSEHNLSESAQDGNIGSLAMGKIKFGWMEGKESQLKAQLLEQTIKPSALLEDYKRLYITQKHNDPNT